MVIKLLDDASALAQTLAKFDAGKARCYLDRDRQKLLAVIEASFGSFYPFNRLVRASFAVEVRRLSVNSGSNGAVCVSVVSPSVASWPVFCRVEMKIDQVTTSPARSCGAGPCAAGCGCSACRAGARRSGRRTSRRTANPNGEGVGSSDDPGGGTTSYTILPLITRLLENEIE